VNFEDAKMLAPTWIETSTVDASAEEGQITRITIPEARTAWDVIKAFVLPKDTDIPLEFVGIPTMDKLTM
jgi:hypothetical protein